MRIWQAALLAGTLCAGAARADVTVGAVLSLTGPAAALGVPERNALGLMPATVGGEPVRLVVLDDGSDSTAAVRAARKLIDEEHADVILGPSTSPTSLAVIDVAAEAGTPVVTLAGCAACVEPLDGKRRWAFKLTPNDGPIMAVLARHMAASGVKRLATVAFANAFGDAFATAMDAAARADGIDPVLTVRFSPADGSTAPQALRVMAAKPDAVFIAASGSPAVTPMLDLRRKGYAGTIYSNPGAASQDVLRLGGQEIDGLVLAVSPFFVAEQLPEGDPVKAEALRFDHAYEAKFGAGTRAQPAASAWDALLLLGAALPAARVAGAPGTAAFRAGLRDGMERAHFAGAQGPFAMSPTDHTGSDERLLVLARVTDGAWVLVK